MSSHQGRTIAVHAAGVSSRWTIIAPGWTIASEWGTRKRFSCLIFTLHWQLRGLLSEWLLQRLTARTTSTVTLSITWWLDCQCLCSCSVHYSPFSVRWCFATSSIWSCKILQQSIGCKQGEQHVRKQEKTTKRMLISRRDKSLWFLWAEDRMVAVVKEGHVARFYSFCPVLFARITA